MKKFFVIIPALLLMSAACFSGCMNARKTENSNDQDEATSRITIVDENEDTTPEDKKDCPDICPDGNCKDGVCEKKMPRKHGGRLVNPADVPLADGEETPCPEKPRCFGFRIDVIFSPHPDRWHKPDVSPDDIPDVQLPDTEVPETQPAN